jgi:hypothetical protein
MQNKVSTNVINIFLESFENHLITMQEQKKTVKEYKEHFTHWMKKQDLSNFREKSRKQIKSKLWKSTDTK